jgi:hypothetical protein
MVRHDRGRLVVVGSGRVVVGGAGVSLLGLDGPPPGV